METTNDEAAAVAAPEWEVMTNGGRLDEVRVRVVGLPRPKGSGRAVMRARKGQSAATARPVVVADAKGLGPWVRTVKRAATQNDAFRPWFTKHAAVGVDLDFVLPPLTSQGKKHRRWPSVRPDVDKLTRAILDALTGVAYVDDGQVVATTQTKRYGDDRPDGRVGVTVTVYRVADDWPGLRPRVRYLGADGGTA
jgi:crossover junction endodeoxyribonuclease RusA